MSSTAEAWLVLRSSTRLETKNDGMHMSSARKQTTMSLSPMESLKPMEREAARTWSEVGNSMVGSLESWLTLYCKVMIRSGPGIGSPAAAYYFVMQSTRSSS